MVRIVRLGSGRYPTSRTPNICGSRHAYLSIWNTFACNIERRARIHGNPLKIASIIYRHTGTENEPFRRTCSAAAHDKSIREIAGQVEVAGRSEPMIKVVNRAGCSSNRRAVWEQRRRARTRAQRASVSRSTRVCLLVVERAVVASATFKASIG